MKGKALDIKMGAIYGSLTVLKEAEGHRTAGGTLLRNFKCKCRCGKTVIVVLRSLTSGHTKSCGCLHKDAVSGAKWNVTHGMSKTPLARKWNSIKDRCYRKKSRLYKYYGARGIKMCNQWSNDFVAFYTWSINNGYKPGLQIDRINNDKGYGPDNCRYVTNMVNSNNRRSNIRVLVGAEALTLANACRKMGVFGKYKVVYQRMKRGGLSFNEAILF